MGHIGRDRGDRHDIHSGRCRGEQLTVRDRFPPGALVDRLGADQHCPVADSDRQRVVHRGRGECDAVGDQQVEPGTRGAAKHLGSNSAYRAAQRLTGRQPAADQRPQQRGIRGCVEREQVGHRQAAGQCRHAVRPPRDPAVVAEQPPASAEGGAGGVHYGHPHSGRAHRGEHRTAAHLGGQRCERRVGPQRDSPPVPDRRDGAVGVPACAEPVGIDCAAATHIDRRVALPQQRVRRGKQQRCEVARRPEVGQVSTHVRSGPPGRRPGRNENR